MTNPFHYFNSSPEVIRLAVMIYIRYPFSSRQVEDLLHERGIDISHETVRAWWNRFGPRFAAEIRKRRVLNGSYSNWRWHLDEVFVKISGETHWLPRAAFPWFWIDIPSLDSGTGKESIGFPVMREQILQ